MRGECIEHSHSHQETQVRILFWLIWQEGGLHYIGILGNDETLKNACIHYYVLAQALFEKLGSR